MASGDTLFEFTPQMAEPASTPATFDETAQKHPVLDYDDTNNETAYFSGVMPRNYAGGGITLYIHYAMSSATSNTIDWDASFERIGDQQQNIHTGEGFASAKSVDDTTVPGTAGLVDIVSISFSAAEADNIAAGEGFRLKITRDAVSDDAAGDAELRFIEGKET